MDTDTPAALLALARGVRALTRAVSALTDATRDMDIRLSASEEATEAMRRELASHVGAAEERQKALLAALSARPSSPLDDAARQHAADVLAGRTGLVGRTSAALRWGAEHPREAAWIAAQIGGGILAASTALRILAVYVPGLGVVAEALEAAMSAVAPIESTGTGGAPWP